tara:strand:+ start:83 stop:475 length:393 start_codon:yes stop_codon:yes gene_type:complete
MELTGFITTGLESLGLNGSEVKPINQGEKVKVQGSEQEERSNLWGIFDGLGETLGEGANDLLAATFDRYVQKTRGGPETSPDTTGDPTDNPGSAVIPESQRNQPGFLQRYQSELIVAGVLLGGFLVLRRR